MRQNIRIISQRSMGSNDTLWQHGALWLHGYRHAQIGSGDRRRVPVRARYGDPLAEPHALGPIQTGPDKEVNIK